MLKALCLEDADNASLKYSKFYGCDEYKLLEVEDSLLQQILDGEVSIKGCENEEAVLCSSSKTYAVKFVSTSNTVLLVPPTNSSPGGTVANEETSLEEGEPAAVVATVKGSIELVQIAPRVDKLQDLLAQNPYKDADVDMEIEWELPSILANEERGLYTWDYLVSNVQASEEELRLALKELGAVQIGRHWRTVDYHFMKGLLDVLLLNAVSHDWNLNALNEIEVTSTMRADGFSDKLVQHCLATYGVQVEGLDARTWSLDHTGICVHYAKGLLSHKDRWKSEEFMNEWQKLLPSEIRPSMDMLKGEALVDRLGTSSWVKGFSRSRLPTKPADRFAALFKERPRWVLEDLQHYLSDLRIPGLSVDAMLLKYTRRSQPDASYPPIYNAR